VALLPDQVWVLKRELTWVPFLGWAVRFMHAISIDRGARGVGGAQRPRAGKARLAEGLWIVIFPEGTRMAPGQTRRYGSAAHCWRPRMTGSSCRFAHDAGYYCASRPVQEAGTIRVVIGPPIASAGRGCARSQRGSPELDRGPLASLTRVRHRCSRR